MVSVPPPEELTLAHRQHFIRDWITCDELEVFPLLFLKAPFAKSFLNGSLCSLGSNKRRLRVLVGTVEEVDPKGIGVIGPCVNHILTAIDVKQDRLDPRT